MHKLQNVYIVTCTFKEEINKKNHTQTKISFLINHSAAQNKNVVNFEI